ncbi:MAG: aminodeoxychorismate/anthranilate synthase component II [Clostridia bacterium]|nr:aminodeoxychorismate/anthranilate synthase component II [Clostridia bacterium]
MILLIDNYDSFSYNLVQLAGSINPDIKVIRNDEMTVEEIRKLAPTHIILSPGPCYPKDAGICEEVALKLRGEMPILGVCLGHQAICEAYGGRIIHAKELMHGKMDRIKINPKCELFSGLDHEINAARYHSLIAERVTIPDCFDIIAEDSLGQIMGVKHKESKLYGLQFHPESILTPQGRIILENFLNIH